VREAERAAQGNLASMPLTSIPFEAGLDSWMGGLEEHRMFGGSARRPGDDAAPVGAVKIKPAEQVSRDRVSPHMEASDNPFWQKYEIAPGFWSLLPRSSDPSESVENLSIWNLPAIIQVNSQKYGPLWTKQFLEKVYGIRIPSFGEQMNKNLPESFRGSLQQFGQQFPGRYRK